tara:strand:+ start:600 stop:1514 length:915 start_codon:yes stop_codon:yes gene_type:complete
MKMKKIALLLGGPSAEKKVSLETGKHVYKSLQELGYLVKKIHVSSNKKIFIEKLKKFNPDFIFNALHGTFGEDGQVQRILDKLKIKYSHSGAKASEIAMNKKKTKLVFKKINIPFPSDLILNENNFKKKIKKIPFKFPLVIKPINEGSSVGVKICKNIKELKNYRLGKKINYLLEEYIPGRELTVGVVNNRVLDVIELKTKNLFYDYNSKYTKGLTKYIIPASIPKSIEIKCKKYALKIHKFLNCKGITRTDFRFDNKDILKKKIYVLEINTQPGMTPLSLVPKMAKYKGITFNMLVKKIIDDI